MEQQGGKISLRPYLIFLHFSRLVFISRTREIVLKQLHNEVTLAANVWRCWLSDWLPFSTSSSLRTPRDHFSGIPVSVPYCITVMTAVEPDVQGRWLGLVTLKQPQDFDSVSFPAYRV